MLILVNFELPIFDRTNCKSTQKFYEMRLKKEKKNKINIIYIIIN